MSGSRTKKLRVLFASELEKVPAKEKNAKFRRIKKMWNNLSVDEKKIKDEKVKSYV